MVKNGRGVLLLVLLFSLLAFAPRAAVASPAAVALTPASAVVSAIVSASVSAVAETSPVAVEPEPEATAEPAPADHTATLVTQFAAGVRGSRAPPAQSA